MVTGTSKTVDKEETVKATAKKATKKAAPKKAAAKTVAPKVEEKTAAEKIWEQIKDIPIDIFALPNQTVEMHVKRDARLEKAMPDAVHVKLKSAAVLPALEEALGKVRLPASKVGLPQMFEFSSLDAYTVIKIVPRIS